MNDNTSGSIAFEKAWQQKLTMSLWINTGLRKTPQIPRVSNQEMNRSLKLIGEMCEITKRLTFHLARHTFATTVTLLNGVPIETISKLLGHTKLSTTMIYTHVMQSKVGLDMSLLQSKLDDRDGPQAVVAAG